MTPLDLKPFARRVRLARAWRGAALGALAGALAGGAWVGLDAARIVFAEPWHVGVLILGGALVGGLVAALRPFAEADLVRSIDRRAGLQDRLTTAAEADGSQGYEAVQGDAARAAQGLRAKALFPFRTTRLHAAAFGLSGIVALLMLLSANPALLHRNDPRLDAAKKAADEIERVAQKALDPKDEPSPEVQRLAAEAMRLKKEIERARLSPEEAVEKGQKLVKEGQKLAEQKFDQAQLKMDEMDTALKRLEKAALEQRGMKGHDEQTLPTSLEQAAQNVEKAEQQADAARAELDAAQQALAQTQAKADAAAKATQSKMDAAKAKADAAKAELAKPGLSDAERKAAEKALADAQRDMAEAQKAMEDAQKAMTDAQKAMSEAQKKLAKMLEGLKLSKEAQDTFAKFMEDPAFKELQKMAQALREKMAKEQARAEAGKPPEFTKEDIENAMKQAEALAKQLQDPEFKKAYLEALKEALKNMKAGGACKNFSLGLGMGMGLGLGGPGPGGDDDRMLFDTKRVNHSDTPIAGEGKTSPSFTPGQRGDGPGPETFVEVRGPSNVGLRSSIPMIREVPAYREKAESAIKANAIPKKHVRRVRDYFTGLGK